VGLSVPVFQPLALYLSFALMPFIPGPRPIPDTVKFGATVCPAVYGLEVLGLVPAIGFEKITCPNPAIVMKNRVIVKTNFSFIMWYILPAGRQENQLKRLQ